MRSVFVGMKKLDQFLLSLTPKSDAQKQVLAAASAAVVAIVVCWSLLLFCGYGLVSPVNGTVIATLALGAIAVASAIFLIIALSQPYSGLFRIPPAGMQQTIEALGS